MTAEQLKAFLQKAYAAAIAAGHVWPKYAACEAALESRWGTSRLCREANNLFGEKQHKARIFDDYVIATHENVDLDHDGVVEPDEVIEVKAAFVKFPSWDACLKARMDTLRRLAPQLEHYRKALNATSGEEFVSEVSKSWATDPERGDKVLQIYRAHAAQFGEVADVNKAAAAAAQKS